MEAVLMVRGFRYTCIFILLNDDYFIGLVGYCPSNAVWTSWFNNNITNSEGGDVESLIDLKETFPEEFTCENPQVSCEIICITPT